MSVVCDISQMDRTVKEIDPDYVSGTVAWCDGSRGVSNGVLSAFGKDITDARIESKDGAFVPHVRSDNYDEQLGVTTSDRIRLIEKDGSEITLDHLLEPDKLNQRVSYMGYKSVGIKHKTKRPIVVRFQHAFVGLNEHGTRAIVPSFYSYQTISRDDPKHLIFLATAQGITVQCDDSGANKLFAHDVESGKVVNKWFDVEATPFAVGQAQWGDKPSCDKKANAVELGLQGMGPRANCFVIVSVPCKQNMVAKYRSLGSTYRSLGSGDTICRSARVSYGAVDGDAPKNEIDLLVDEEAPIVVTVLCYNTVEHPVKNIPVPIPKDSIRLAVEDMKRCLNLCLSSCKLSQLPAMLHKLTQEDMTQIYHKVNTDHPPSVPSTFLPNLDALNAFK